MYVSNFSAIHCLISSHFKTSTENIYEISIFFFVIRKLLQMLLLCNLSKSAENDFLFTFNEVVGAINRF